ncbi:Anaerobic C4-dicarboxylate transporter DcuB [Stieleria neptunia]|uniref:Anaerobic C4-dicarboxylate transporter DcuB n=1 Tax=Stieleria neptunia TaxID=2527979 RepID=A0A518HTX0_9BACT|nr:anaerobic C4-dicarboxylate transporter family protein [Stieleria neptunia]QDV44253.1 Anaerobic C4-dicarboxylate transporter DcuB [Stieleria neptunia]
MSWQILAQGLVVLSCLGIGSRMGGVAVGLWGGIGVLLLSTFFHLTPGGFPIAAITIIFSVVTAAGAMQAAGGIDYLVGIAHRILRSRPNAITYLAPYVSWIFTIGAGTGNVYYSLLPVIEETSYSNKVRPERPLALAPEASQMGITSSPVSAAMAVLLGMLSPLGFELGHVLVIVLPSTVVSIAVAALIQNRVGKELDHDPLFLSRLEAGEIQKPDYTPPELAHITKRAKWSVAVFLSGILLVVMLGFVDSLRPQVLMPDGLTQPMAMTQLIAIVMMVAGVVIIVIGKVHPGEIPRSDVFQSGMVSALALMGIAWMANTFIGAHKELLSSVMLGQIEQHVWMLPVAYYATAALTTSQSTATLIITPVALAMGIAPEFIVASWLAVIGIHFFPANGSQMFGDNWFSALATTSIPDYESDFY